MKRPKKTSAKLRKGESKVGGGPSDMYNQEIPKHIVKKRLKKKKKRK